MDKIEFDEKSTAYFYKRLQLRNKNRQIKLIKDNGGQFVTEPTEIPKATHDLYKKLYKSEQNSNEQDQNTLQDQIDKILTPEKTKEMND